MTQRLYETDSYCKEFTAVVTACNEENGEYFIVLDRTAFFPEGGGQAPDKGSINGIEVLDVQREGDIVLHKTASPLKLGEPVTGKIDWELRFARMQAHAGEHILSGVVHSLFGYSNVGFHMGQPLMTVDFSGTLSLDDIKTVELLSNRAVYSNAPITVSYPTKEELESLPYRSKIDTGEDTRIVTIEGIDCCACCAPHPARTGEIGLIKIVNFYPHRQGTRVEMLAGLDAFADYCAINASNKQIMGMLAAPRDGIVEAVQRLSDTAQALRSENQQLAKRLALAGLSPVKVEGSMYAVMKELSFDELRYCANTLTTQDYDYCILLSLDEQGWCYVAASKEKEVKPLVAGLNTAFGGKGGGKGGYAQGKLPPVAEAELIDKVTLLLKENFTE